VEVNNQYTSREKGQVSTPEGTSGEIANMNKSFGYGLMRLASLGSEASAYQNEKRKESTIEENAFEKKTKPADETNQSCPSFEITIPR
jgi:hypothetical protein